jgi:beta-lactamase class A
MRFCTSCGSPLNEESAFCTNCGAKNELPVSPEKMVSEVEDGQTTCPNCGELLEPGSVFCTNCGMNLSKTLDSLDEEKSGDSSENSIVSQESSEEQVHEIINDIEENSKESILPIVEKEKVEAKPKLATVVEQEKETTKVESKAEQEKDAQLTRSDSKLKEQVQPQRSDEPARSLKKRSKKIIVGSMVAVIVIAIAGGGAYFGLNHHNVATTATTATTASVSNPEKSGADRSAEKSKSTTTQQTSSSSTIEKNESQLLSQLATNSGVQQLSSATGVYLTNLNDTSVNHDYVYNGDMTIRAASTIKLFIMLEFYKAVASNSVSLNDTYTLADGDKVPGTGIMQNASAGTVYTYQAVLSNMIEESDNTAGNVIINVLGGTTNLSRKIQRDGYKNTSLKRLFGDTVALANGTDNYTTVNDVAAVMTAIYHKKAVSAEYDQAMLSLLHDYSNHEKIPADVSSDVMIYNKSGEYPDYGVQNDACILERGNQAYLAVVMSQDGEQVSQFNAMNTLGSEIENKCLKGN